MNDKIKEILEDIKGIYYFKPLLDYITNLQQENERLKEIIKENTILVKDENGNYQECNINPLDYKSRIEKAVEYIKRFDLIIGYYDYNDEGYDEIGENNNLQEELLNILNGKE